MSHLKPYSRWLKRVMFLFFVVVMQALKLFEGCEPKIEQSDASLTVSTGKPVLSKKTTNSEESDSDTTKNKDVLKEGAESEKQKEQLGKSKGLWGKLKHIPKEELAKFKASWTKFKQKKIDKKRAEIDILDESSKLWWPWLSWAIQENEMLEVGLLLDRKFNTTEKAKAEEALYILEQVLSLYPDKRKKVVSLILKKSGLALGHLYEQSELENPLLNRVVEVCDIGAWTALVDKTNLSDLYAKNSRSVSLLPYLASLRKTKKFTVLLKQIINQLGTGKAIDLLLDTDQDNCSAIEYSYLPKGAHPEAVRNNHKSQAFMSSIKARKMFKSISDNLLVWLTQDQLKTIRSEIEKRVNTPKTNKEKEGAQKLLPIIDRYINERSIKKQYDNDAKRVIEKVSKAKTIEEKQAVIEELLSKQDPQVLWLRYVGENEVSLLRLLFKYRTKVQPSKDELLNLSLNILDCAVSSPNSHKEIINLILEESSLCLGDLFLRRQTPECRDLIAPVVEVCSTDAWKSLVQRSSLDLDLNSLKDYKKLLSDLVWLKKTKKFKVLLQHMIDKLDPHNMIRASLKDYKVQKFLIDSPYMGEHSHSRIVQNNSKIDACFFSRRGDSNSRKVAKMLKCILSIILMNDKQLNDIMACIVKSEKKIRLEDVDKLTSSIVGYFLKRQNVIKQPSYHEQTCVNHAQELPYIDQEEEW